MILCLEKKGIDHAEGSGKSLRVTDTTGREGIAIILSLKFYLFTGSSLIFVQLMTAFKSSFLCSILCADWFIVCPDHLLRACQLRRLRSQDSLSLATWLNGKEKLKIRRIF